MSKTLEYTKEEMLIIVAVLTAIMNADLRIAPEEVEFLNKVISDFRLSNADIDALDNIDASTIIELFKNMEAKKKSNVKDIFMKMAACDGFVDPREVEIINRLCQ